MPEAENFPSDGERDRPAVVPRAHRVGTEASLPIDRFVLLLMESGKSGVVRVAGSAGGGKTTAMRYLRSVLPASGRFSFLDEGKLIDLSPGAGPALAISSERVHGDVLETLELCPWTLDDCMEYLAATHRDKCAAILSQFERDKSVGMLQGSPQLLTLVMDAIASDATGSARDILREHVWRIIGPRRISEAIIITPPDEISLEPEVKVWWRHEVVRRLYAARWVAEQLGKGRVPRLLKGILRHNMILEIAEAVRHRPAAIEMLKGMIVPYENRSAVAAAASILLALDPDWRPKTGQGLDLNGAWLCGAQWAGLDLWNAILANANLMNADLSGANLSQCQGSRADFTGANLRSAKMEDASFEKAKFNSAYLRGIHARKTCFTAAEFEWADCSHGDFSEASFWSAKLDGANFSGANCQGIRAEQLDMTCADWTGVSFARAKLVNCNLEGLNLPSADFSEAILTGSLFSGSRCQGANFSCANLRKTGLADVEWENADLRGTDFTDASFHLGSSRSGLVGSVIPCEGSKMGFYTDDFEEQNFKPPKEIRKACLCGANLMGAKVDKADFYLVDLRGAVYSHRQREHFARCKAILVSKVK